MSKVASMYLTYFYSFALLILSLLALIHFFKTRSPYSILMLLYLSWPTIFIFLCKHFIVFGENTVTLFSFKIEENSDVILEIAMVQKLVGVLLVIPFFLYVMNKEMEKNRERK